MLYEKTLWSLLHKLPYLSELILSEWHAVHTKKFLSLPAASSQNLISIERLHIAAALYLLQDTQVFCVNPQSVNDHMATEPGAILRLPAELLIEIIEAVYTLWSESSIGWQKNPVKDLRWYASLRSCFRASL